MAKLNLQDILSDKASVKFACAKQATIISRENPLELYADFDFFADLLDHSNKILKWNAIQIIGNLSRVDEKKKVDKNIGRLIAYLRDKSLITAANAIGALTEIAINKPKHQDEIVKALLKVEKANYYSKGALSPECRNVAIGHVVKSFARLGGDILKRKNVRNFLVRQMKNTRPKVKKDAEKLLKKAV
jgi:hypothetical protein